MLRLLAFVALMICSIAALCADDQPVRTPYVEVGDCWSYRAEGMAYRASTHEYEHCITLIDRAKGTILGVATLKDDGREFDTVHSVEWAIFASHSGLISSEGVRLYKFPLKVGDSYSIAFEFRDARFGPNSGRASYDIKVTGWEDVTVPAGTFHTLKIEGRGMVRRYDKQIEFPHSLTWWYSPKVNRHVKSRYQNPGRITAEELTGYRLNQ